MFEQKALQNLNECFKELNKRKSREVYFYRLNGYNDNIKDFIIKYYEAARASGVVIEGGIANPDEKNLSYYGEIMGLNFQHSRGFISSSLKKWLPRMNDYQRENVAIAIYDTLDILRKEGKNLNILKNTYIKFMCWLYYKFERVITKLGNDNIPKILYEGNIGNYELRILTVMSKAGCDIVLLQYKGDGGYLKLDPTSKFSNAYTETGMLAFPENFNIKWIMGEIQSRLNIERLYGILPNIKNCTNAWIDGNGLEDILKSTATRGTDSDMFYNCFMRINGVWDKLLYLNDLYQFQLQLLSNKRNVVIVENFIEKPTMDEISQIKRKNYRSNDQMLLDLSTNIKYSANIQLQRLMVKAFIDVLMEESKRADMNLNKLTNKAVYLLCWLNRYQTKLFTNWKMPEIACFIYLGGCKDENEAMLLKFLGGLPVDVCILVPNLNIKCALVDKFLYEKNYSDSMDAQKFPSSNSQISMSTAAHQAERELDTLMYQDSGMYRNRQYSQGVAVNLQTMYEEIPILWDQELKYRPSFSVVDNLVNIPVIFAKISGVKNGHVPDYWAGIKALKTSNTLIISEVPYIKTMEPNPIKPYATEFLKNKRIQKDKIKAHQVYRYGFLREEAQNHILEKLQLLINQRTIKGTGENGCEYTIVSTVLNLNKDILRMIQNFDFTKKNPKIIYINTKENALSLEDSILMAFLNLIGFDILFFIPTGYQGVERFYNDLIVKEHQIGEYLYDLRVPNFDMIMSSNNNRQSWKDKLFKRGR